MITLGLDIGSNSVGSAWIDQQTGGIATGVSVFPAGVAESEDKRGDPKNAKRRMTRRTRITLARRAERKRQLRLKLIEFGLLPQNEKCETCPGTRESARNRTCCFRRLLETTDPWELRRRGLDQALSPFEFGRVLLHLAQRRGALGLRIPDQDDESETDQEAREDGKVKSAILDVERKRKERNARTFGEYIAMVRAERVTTITTDDKRRAEKRKGPREWREPVRNKAASYEHCADRAMIRCEFEELWKRQAAFNSETAYLLTPALKLILDDESGDSVWRHKGLLFGQRRQSWDLGTLGRCSLHPDQRCVPHADMNASRYLVVETVNNLKIIDHGQEARPLKRDERETIIAYLSSPLGVEKGRKKKGDKGPPPERPKRTVSVTDLRNFMGTAKEGWGRASKASRFHFTIENDEERTINTNWFSREIICGAIASDVWSPFPTNHEELLGAYRKSIAKWEAMPPNVREGLNRAILRLDPDSDEDAEKLKVGAMDWGGLTETQADALVSGWRTRPRVDSRRLNMSRRAVRNLLSVMDRPEPWPNTSRTGRSHWLTEIEARKIIADDADFLDITTGEPFDQHTNRRYATGAKGATARDRYYMGKHVLMKDGHPVIGPDGRPLPEPPPAPLISNPVVRKAIHEVRRHLIAYMTEFARKPDEVYVELAREARMGKVDADRLLLRNRLRNRIRRDIIDTFELNTQTSTQQRAAVDRVVLCIQQGCVCPLCGEAGLTPRQAATGEGCEVAHIIPKASGGHNGLSNTVLAHTKCNRDMGRRTPRQFWSDGDGFEKGMTWIERIYGAIERPKPSEFKSAKGNALWLSYFTRRDDWAKIEQFKKDVKDIQEMTPRQEAATKHAARQVMGYLADALYGGKGLPERGSGSGDQEDKRRIFATDGLWTSRLRQEWGLFFDPHQARSHGLSNQEEQQRKEKNRGDHRHHAIDAIITALSVRHVQIDWDNRERKADKDGINTADEVAMANYRRANPLPFPQPFKSRDDLRETVRGAVFGGGEIDKPVCHRPVKRRLVGALHEETLFGPVLDRGGNLTGNYTARKSVLSLDSNHLRMPRPESEKEAIERLAARRQRSHGSDSRASRKWARTVVSSPGYRPATVDPPPGKSGVVRDVALRARIRQCLIDAGLDPENFSATDIKKLAEAGGLRQASGVPIRSVVLLRTMSDPVIASRWATDYATGDRCKVYDGLTGRGQAAAARAYVGGNNHHIEIREDAKGNWTGAIVSAYEAAQVKLARLSSFREAGVPKPDAFRKLSTSERLKFKPILKAIDEKHPLVDRRDDERKGGRFIMSLCEGEMLLIKHKQTGEMGYYVVAKLDKPRSIVLVPHWDARPATGRKDADGKKVSDSQREQFSVTPNDLKTLAPPGHSNAIKVRVSPLGEVTHLEKD